MGSIGDIECKDINQIFKVQTNHGFIKSRSFKQTSELNLGFPLAVVIFQRKTSMGKKRKRLRNPLADALRHLMVSFFRLDLQPVFSLTPVRLIQIRYLDSRWFQ